MLIEESYYFSNSAVLSSTPPFFQKVLSAIVGKREIRKRLKDKQNYVLGDVGLFSELKPNKDVLWHNTY